MRTKKQTYLLSLISIICGLILAISFTSHYLGFLYATRFEEVALLLIWGGFFSIISYDTSKRLLSVHPDKVWSTSQTALIFMVALLTAIFLISAIWNPPLLPVSIQETLGELFDSEVSILSFLSNMLRFDITLIWKIIIIIVSVSDLLSLSIIFGTLIFAGMVAAEKLSSWKISIKPLFKFSFPYIILMSVMVIGNLVLFGLNEKQNYYHLRELDGNTLDELVRKSSDTTPLLRVYTTYHQYYPGSQLTIVSGSLKETGFIIEDLWARASVREIREQNVSPMYSETDIEKIKALSQTTIDLSNTSVKKRYYFLPPESGQVDEILLIQDNENVFFIPEGFDPKGVKQP